MSDYPCGANRLVNEPTGYVEWHEWARKKAYKYTQMKCPKCGLWHIWTLKPDPRRVKNVKKD